MPVRAPTGGEVDIGNGDALGSEDRIDVDVVANESIWERSITEKRWCATPRAARQLHLRHCFRSVERSGRPKFIRDARPSCKPVLDFHSSTGWPYSRVEILPDVRRAGMLLTGRDENGLICHYPDALQQAAVVRVGRWAREVDFADTEKLQRELYTS